MAKNTQKTNGRKEIFKRQELKGRQNANGRRKTSMVSKERKKEVMPLVGKKKFPYTKKGVQAAKAYAKKTGKKLRRK